MCDYTHQRSGGLRVPIAEARVRLGQHKLNQFNLDVDALFFINEDVQNNQQIADDAEQCYRNKLAKPELKEAKAVHGNK